jgi:glycosyltransferase involved in cell wall biosynthesis
MVAALQRQGHEVRIFTPNPGKGNTLPMPIHHVDGAGLPDLCVRFTPSATCRVCPRLGKELRELAYNLTLYRSVLKQRGTWSPDCVYERYTLFNLAGLAVARRFGVPHLLEVNAPLQMERERTIGLTLRLLAERFDRQLFRGADGVLVVSHALRSYILDHGADEERVSLLPNGVDTERFRSDTEAAGMRTQLGLAPDAFVVGFAGSLKPWHGTDVLLDAFALLHKEAQRARLLIVGDGPQRDALRERASQLALQGAVVFTGAVPHDEMPAMLRAMDVGVAPYLEIPDFYFSPLKLYEYMASGLPVVASDAGEIGTLIRHEETGVLVPCGNVAVLADRLLRLKRDEMLRSCLGNAARLEAERHSWNQNARFVAKLAAQLSRHDGARGAFTGAARPRGRSTQA